MIKISKPTILKSNANILSFFFNSLRENLLSECDLFMIQDEFLKIKTYKEERKKIIPKETNKIKHLSLNGINNILSGVTTYDQASDISNESYSESD